METFGKRQLIVSLGIYAKCAGEKDSLKVIYARGRG